ncbi:DM DNA binding domain protein [Ancylostoma duodenale]|uniref:DM DNA binding domain protein n=1 Tax=Ancylostoma duodenale TaxID=51022 RepID=A0A0C2GX18_9BILA|nr:DM DNA binding domain protein [Ancylostoma duodenale]
MNSRSLESEIDVVALSPAPSQNSYNSNQSEKKYFCQRCLNHDLQFPRKGHKPVCKYANCTCSDCIMVEQRRQLNNMLSKSKPIAAGRIAQGDGERTPGSRPAVRPMSPARVSSSPQGPQASPVPVRHL